MPKYPGYYLKILSILLAILLFTLPLAYWPHLFEAASLPRYFLIAIISCVALIVWSISNGARQIIWHPAFALILVFLGWASVSTSWSPDPGTALIDIVQLCNMVVLAFLAMQLSVSSTFIKLSIPAILAGAGLAAIIGIGQYFGLNPFEFRKNGNAIPATFINPNHAAVFFDFIPPLSLTAILFYQRPTLRWLAATTLGLSVAYLLINTSRGSLLAFIVVILALILVVLLKPEIRTPFKLGLKIRYKEILLASLIPVMIFLLPGGENIDKWDTALLEGTTDKATNFRFAMYLNSFPAIVDHPITGMGYGGIRVGFQPYTSSLLPSDFRTEDTALRELHNDPLQYFVELGLPGGLLAVAIFFILLRTGWNTFSSTSSNTKQFIALGFWLALIACGVHALVDFPLRLPASAALFWISSGILLGLDKSRSKSLTGPLNRPIRYIVAAMGLIGLLICLPFYKAYLGANHDLYNSLVNLKKGNCVAAAHASQHGLGTFPFDFMLPTTHARIYTFCSFPAQQKLAAMNRVLEYDPSNMRARLTRALLYSEANRPDLAIPEFLMVAENLPHRPTAYAGLGDSALQQGDRIQARHYYIAALKRNPDYKYVIKQLDQLDSGVEQQ